MKKFSTAAFFFTLVSASNSFALSDPATAKTPRCAILGNAPDQHQVVRGDTLWSISGKFLQNAWCWPEVWGMNREQIQNPHWIYPGQVVYLDRATGRLRLGTPVGSDTGGENSLPTVRLSSQLRTEGLGQHAVTSIPSGVIEPFLSQPLIIEEGELKDAPHIMATKEGRVVMGKGDKAYVRGDLKAGTSFQVFRTGTALKDPDNKKVIGHEAVYLGTLKLDRAARTADEAHAFNVVTFKEEMAIGDRLLPLPPTPIVNYVPHPPEQPVAARIISIYGGVTQAGQNQIVAINRGKNHGIDLGTVLELYRFGPIVTDKTKGLNYFWSMNNNQVKLPDEQYGTLFIFRVFNNISYGLVMQVTDTVQVGDVAKSPEQ